MKNCQTINVSNYQALCKSKKVRLIDIRTPDEYASEHIHGSEHIMVEQLPSANFSKDDCVVFHCRSGHRTQQAEPVFRSIDADDVFILEGGLIAWKKAGLTTSKNAKAPFPIMRQVQIVVGLMVLLGIILSYFVSPYFNLLSAFFGAGLLFAGLTDTCALANLLMKLPFNKTKGS